MNEDYKRIKNNIIMHGCIFGALFVISIVAFINAGPMIMYLPKEEQNIAITIIYLAYLAFLIGYSLFIRKKIAKKNKYIDELYIKGQITTEQHEGSKKSQNKLKYIGYILLIIVLIIKLAKYL